jgi:V/A-type H+-transporting ATPase subunit F
MTKIALVADKNTVTCFKLAGLRDVYSVENAKEAERRIGELSEQTDFVIILITERIADQINATIQKIMERKYPLIIPIPDVRGPIKMKTDLIVDLIRSKAGIEVKLR